jgi:hypothetical protein
MSGGIYSSMSAYGGAYTTDTRRWTLEYIDIYGEFQSKVYDTEKKALDAQSKLKDEYNHEALLAEKNYIDAFIGQLEKKNEAAIESEKSAQEVMLGDAYSFANAREELFFGGNKAGFTGTLMKQVMQGGVENLLYKTEIVQTNVFNGMTLPEMIQQVSAGVIDELRSQNVLS